MAPAKATDNSTSSFGFLHMCLVELKKSCACVMTVLKTELLTVADGCKDSGISSSSVSSTNCLFALASSRVSGIKRPAVAVKSIIARPRKYGIQGLMFIACALIGVATISAAIASEVNRNNAVALFSN